MKKNNKLKKYSIKDIRALCPCYDPDRYITENWEGTVLDILEIEECPAEDRIWVAAGLLDDRSARLFAVHCARKGLELVDNPDKRSVHACEVAERYALGEATDEELSAARAAARAAASAAASVAAWDAASVAAWDAARAAGSVAAWDAADDAAWAAARAAADDAARAAAWDAGRVAARENQVSELKKIIRGER